VHSVLSMRVFSYLSRQSYFIHCLQLREILFSVVYLCLNCVIYIENTQSNSFLQLIDIITQSCLLALGFRTHAQRMQKILSEIL
jgi:hypothetical protein